LYSNLSRKWASGSDVSATPLFLLITGLALLMIRLGIAEHTQFDAGNVMGLAYLIVFPTTLGYIFWDVAVREGNLILIASLSYVIPLASTIFSSYFLGVALTANLWLACALTIAGAAICKYSVKN
jgi:drug/metabolite transporter (DMT)-like permease